MEFFRIHTGFVADVRLKHIVCLIWSYTLNVCSFKIHCIVCQSGSIQEIENTIGI